MADDINVGGFSVKTYDIGADHHQVMVLPGDYETVAASQTTQTLGATGAVGDYICDLVVIPATTAPGSVQIKDGSDAAVTVFTGGGSSVSNLVPFSAVRGARSKTGAWQVTTGANVSVFAVGKFT